MEGLMARCGSEKLNRDQLITILPPEATDTHQTIAHAQLVNSVIETLSFRHINVVKDEYAVSQDGMKLFGVIELETIGNGFRFAIGLRNANDKSMRFGFVARVRVFCCDNMAFSGGFQPVLAKHTKHCNLQDALAVGIDQMQRNFKPLSDQIERWRATQIPDEYARLTIYKAFIEDELDAPQHLAKLIHKNYFEPEIEESTPRTNGRSKTPSKEYGWSVSSFPDALARAEANGYACFGGQFQFRRDDGTTWETYWLDADAKERAHGESWVTYCRRSCSGVLNRFQHLASATDFAKEASSWPSLQINPTKSLVFVAYFVTEGWLAALVQKLVMPIRILRADDDFPIRRGPRQHRKRTNTKEILCL